MDSIPSYLVHLYHHGATFIRIWFILDVISLLFHQIKLNDSLTLQCTIIELYNLSISNATKLRRLSISLEMIYFVSSFVFFSFPYKILHWHCNMSSFVSLISTFNMLHPLQRKDKWAKATSCPYWPVVISVLHSRSFHGCNEIRISKLNFKSVRKDCERLVV